MAESNSHTKWANEWRRPLLGVLDAAVFLGGIPEAEFNTAASIFVPWAVEHGYMARVQGEPGDDGAVEVRYFPTERGKAFLVACFKEDHSG